MAGGRSGADEVKAFAIAIAALLAVPAAAEVKSSSSAGFELENRRTVRVSPSEAFAALRRISGWWSKDHTYSGDAKNLSLGLEAGNCFCERIPDGGTVEHMRVVQSRPGRLLRLQGGLGPLQAEAAMGTLTFMLKPVPGGTEITQSYIVGGYIRPGAERLASPVDKVLAQQLDGLVRMLGDKGAN
jgi:uncharacterized protein YndB with AHSA1/START domain